jgi:hypothetical protein
MDNVTDASFDQAGFEAFFKTHPNDATIAEEFPEDTNTDDNDVGGASSDTSGSNNASGAGDNTNAGDNGDNSQQSDDGANQAQQTDDNKTANANAKQAQAFAQMRIANQQQQQLIKQIAAVVGVENTKDTGAMMKALEQLVVKAQSQKQGIPEEVLQRLNDLENTNKEYQKQQAYLAAGRGFQTIKDKYGLDNDGLEAFAQELIADGLNPYEQPIDLVAEYKLRHFDSMLEQAVQRGIEQEAQRAAKAGAQGSTPSNTKGGRDDSDTPKINSVSELNKWLDENK